MKSSDIILYTILIMMLIIVIWLIYSYFKSIKLEKRLAKYSINSTKTNDLSIGKSFSNVFKNLIKSISNILIKLNVKGKRYNKYIKTFNSYQKPTDFIAAKIITSLEFLMLVIISQVFLIKLVDIFSIVISLIIGYYLLDVVYIIRYNKYKKEIKEEFLEAIIIMNSAFASGKSIIQAVDIVSKELNNEVGKQFQKMSLELGCGLSVELVFKKLADTLDLEEVNYLASSLTVLNKTGGNIVKIFSSIEKTLYNQKKIHAEYKSLTSSSRLLIWVLIIVPVLFAFMLNIFSPGYFNILFTNVLGITILVSLLAIYTLYIIVVYNVLKVKV